MAKKSSAYLIAIALVLILAAALRFYGLDAQSFWNDEGNSARAAERSIPLILEAAEGDIHPPGYYLLLHYWRMAVGESEFALRTLSAMCSILTVAITYALGRRLLGAPAGIWSALLAALSPLAIYYSQEARMYTMLGLCSAASTYLLLISMTRSPFALAGYVLTTTAGLYTQYTFPLILLVHNILFLGWWIVNGTDLRRRKALTTWIITQAAIVLLYLPWVPAALERIANPPSRVAGLSLLQALELLLHTLVSGTTLEVGATRWLPLIAAALLLGLWPRRSRTGATTALAVWLAVPAAALVGSGLYRPEYLKVMLIVLPPFHLLTAQGADNVAAALRRITPSASWVAQVVLHAALIATLVIPSLGNLYLNPAYFRNDYRQIVADIAQIARPGDGIILNAANQWEVFTYYHRTGAPVYPLPRSRPPRAHQVSGELDEIALSHQRLFVVYWGDAESDPQRLVESWLSTNAYKAESRWYGSVRVNTYGLAALPQEPSRLTNVQIGEMIHLQGFDLGEGPFTQGDILPITLFWATDEQLAQRHKVFVHLIGSEGSLVAQADGEPQAGLNPTTVWHPDETHIDRHGVLVPQTAPAGEYTLLTGLYDLLTGERLTVRSVEGGESDHVVLGTISLVGR
jgi:4-amino-4-deoxy-L-arabinose transferase-like glycosyltransferase